MIASTGPARICLPGGIAFGKRKVQRAVNRARLLEVPGGLEPNGFKRILDRTDTTVSGADVPPPGGSRSLRISPAGRKTGICKLRFSSGDVLSFKLIHQRV